jgi:hypothetical protein
MSCISDGKGKVLFFKVEDIVKIMTQCNPDNYEWNSHTSIAYFNGIKGKNEDKWNKWEYDPFLGSGTTAVACKELGRNFIGIEISQKYCDIAETRLKNTVKEMFV